MAVPPSVQEIKCGLLNIQSVRNKAHEIRELIKEENIDIFALTETWLSDYDYSVINEMTPITHSFLNVPRLNRKGGGVGVFLSNSFKKLGKLYQKIMKALNY